MENPYFSLFLQVRTDREVVCYEALCALPNEAVPLTPIPPYQKTPDNSTQPHCPLRWKRMNVACPLMAPGRLRSDPRVADVQVCFYCFIENT